MIGDVTWDEPCDECLRELTLEFEFELELVGIAFKAGEADEEVAVDPFPETCPFTPCELF